jgi:non-specific protein-tyrosine kinase
MSTYATSTAAAERIGRRFAEDERKRASLGLPPVSPRAAGETGHRLEIVRRDGEQAAVPAPERQPFATARSASWAPVAASSHGVAVEQYRRLAGALIRAQAEHGVKVVMITSAVAGEGKSLTTSNLAVTLARSYQRRTLIIDADQRDPSQHKIFHVDNTRGLTEHMRSFDGTPAATVELFPGLTLLPAGRPTSDPMGGLTSNRLKQLFADAAEAFDIVLIDTPPVTLIPDAGLLAPLVDAAVLVISAGSTQYEAVSRAVMTLGRERILGTVLNGADEASFGHYGYGYGPRNE